MNEEETPVTLAWKEWVKGFKKAHSSPGDIASAYLGFVAGWNLRLDEDW